MKKHVVNVLLSTLIFFVSFMAWQKTAFADQSCVPCHLDYSNVVNNHHYPWSFGYDGSLYDPYDPNNPYLPYDLNYDPSNPYSLPGNPYDPAKYSCMPCHMTYDVNGKQLIGLYGDGCQDCHSFTTCESDEWKLGTPRIANTPPILNPIYDQQGQEYELLTFTITASDSDVGDVLTFGASNLPPGATFDTETGVFSWTPGYDQAGEYLNVEFLVQDNGNPIGVASTLITIVIGNVNQAPKFTTVGIQSVGSKEVLENGLLEFCVQAEDPDGDNVTYSTDTLPGGALFSPASHCFTWTPDQTQAGNYTIIFYATDDWTPQATGITEVAVTVGDVPTPVEMADLIDTTVQIYDLPSTIESTYLANVNAKKIGDFIEKGQINSAKNNLQAFINKVELDFAAGEINEDTRNTLVAMATDLLNALTN